MLHSRWSDEECSARDTRFGKVLQHIPFLTINSDKYRPDRVIIESSGSALPATLALQIRQLEEEYIGDFKLDSIVTVIDAENFAGYDDESPTAKLQAKFCDVILVVSGPLA